MVGELTRDVVSRGHRILQIFKLGACDTSHVRALLDFFDLPKGARVLDVGCGVGEVSRVMRSLRPDLRFTLSNISQAQLALCPVDMPQVCAAAERLPFEDGSFDAVLVFYTMGHTALSASFAEYERCLSGGGTLCIYDMLNRKAPDCLASLGYHLYPFGDILREAVSHGMRLRRSAEKTLKANTKDFMDIMPKEQFANTFAGVSPLLAQFEK